VKRLLFLLVVAVATTAWAGASARAQEPAPTPTTIPDGVLIGSVAVGGLPPEVAFEQVRAEYALPLVVTFGEHVFETSPEQMGTPAIQKAVDEALVAAPGTTVPLTVAVNRARVRAYVAELTKRFARAPVDARLYLRRFRPLIAREVVGRKVDALAAERDMVIALQTGSRLPVALKAKTLRPKVTMKDFGPVVVIRRNSNKLFLYKGMRYWRVFGVATGTRQYPTPLGRFRVVVKWKNPWWYPPDSPWAKDKEPVPPGPSNPLGTRWMGISSPGVGIHGTPEPGSIGYSVSHGCIRMRIPDAEWLFERLTVGTTVFIVSA
jgi:lipoprotein-anchoring transpeptidase ErfK/SrfK